MTKEMSILKYNY